MKKIVKTYPQSKWAAYADFARIDNQLCGDWQGLPECPEKESGFYERYANQYPDGPRTAEALYDVAWRQGSLVDMYAEAGNQSRAAAAAAKTKQFAGFLQKGYPHSDYATRAAALVFRIDQKIAIYGNDRRLAICHPERSAHRGPGELCSPGWKRRSRRICFCLCFGRHSEERL